MADLYGYFVGIVGIDPVYFLDEISQDEMSAIIKARGEIKKAKDKTTWEQTRMISYWNFVSVRGNKGVEKPEDLFFLPWDKEKRTPKSEMDEIRSQFKKRNNG